jgi:hypothetical protein
MKVGGNVTSILFVGASAIQKRKARAERTNALAGFEDSS